ncbi:MAG: FHA domain-containing protein [Maioricimonas sp. JB045]
MPHSESAARAGVPAHPESASQRMDVVCFVVRRGRTRFPQRPLTGERFLIGSGSNCQLQLGGGEIPMLHSVVVRDEEGLWIEALVPTPQLSINGVNTRAGRLGVGDVIAIGPFEFSIQAASIVGDSTETRTDEQPTGPDKPPAAMTAAELVDAIADDVSEVESWEEDRRAGAAAMLEAAKAAESSAAGPDEPASIPVTEPLAAPPNERFPADLARRAAALMAAQNQLAEMLQTLSDQLRDLDSPDDDQELRVSA